MPDMQLAPILGEEITVGKFDRQWVTQLTILNGEYLSVVLVPYDGTHTLSEPVSRLDEHDIHRLPQLAELVANVTALCKSLANQTAEPQVITVNAPVPSKPIQCVALYPNPRDQRHPIVQQIDDLMSLAAIDQDVAVVFGGMIDWIASQRKGG